MHTAITAKGKARQVVAASDKNALDYVIRRFNVPSARLNKPVGLDLRWDTALARFPESNWSPKSAEVRLEKVSPEGDSRFHAELDCN